MVLIQDDGQRTKINDDIRSLIRRQQKNNHRIHLPPFRAGGVVGYGCQATVSPVSMQSFYVSVREMMSCCGREGGSELFSGCPFRSGLRRGQGHQSQITRSLME